MAKYGQTLTYTLTVTNAGASPVSGVSVSQAFPAELDLATATWTCNAGGGTCTASGTGALSDSGVTVAAGGSVTYTLTATVLADSTSSQVDNEVTVTDGANTHNAGDIDTLVIFRGGFENGDDGGNIIATAPAAHVQPATVKKTSTAKQKK